MLTYPDIDPVALAFGPFEVHWYGLMYLVAFVAGWWLGVIRTRREGTAWQRREIGDLVFYFALGAVLGGRIGYTLMYNLDGFLADPLVIARIWQGGMSYHGGMVGVFVAMWLYGRHTGRTFFQVTELETKLDGGDAVVHAQVRDNTPHYLMRDFDVRLVYAVDGGLPACVETVVCEGTKPGREAPWHGRRWTVHGTADWSASHAAVAVGRTPNSIRYDSTRMPASQT